MALARVRTPTEGKEDSIENLFAHKTTKDPFLTLSKTGDTSLQWIQLLQALDQQGKLESCTDKKEEQQQPLLELKSEKYLPGWPLLSPPTKVQMQKCEKCSAEFCSTINYRRHIKMHRRSPMIDKDFAKNREYIGAFWDKLTLKEASDIVSLSDISIEGTSGTTITKYLLMWNRKPNYVSLPCTYTKAGNNLLDIVLTKPGTLPIQSKELFNIFDDASEKTFMTAGNATLIQKFLFDGDAEKVILEMKNLAACLSLLIEQKLVKAWLDDKAQEALRCQKLLVEEEEAAQKKQAELMEKKRLKKLRQKEKFNLKETINSDSKTISSSVETKEFKSISTEIPSPKSLSESDSSISEEQTLKDPICENSNSVSESVKLSENKENCAGDNGSVLIGSISVAVENGSYSEIRKDGITENNNKDIPESNRIRNASCVEIRKDGIMENNKDIPDSNGKSEDGFSSKEAAAFLAQRWKDALASDHIMLVFDSPNSSFDSTNNSSRNENRTKIPKSRPKSRNNLKTE